jgi:enterochelin esterase family protein
MKIKILVIAFLACAGLTSGQRFERFFHRLNSMPEPERQAVADSFMAAVQTFPLHENDTLVYFLYTGKDTESVALAGDATGWNPGESFTRLAGTTLWYLRAVYEADARLDYKFVVNGRDWITDPLNPYTCTGGFGTNSELRMPLYSYPPEISFNPDIPHGTLRDTIIFSSLLGNTRPVRVYLPPGYPAGEESYPVILFHDGPEYISLGQADNIFDFLISEKLMKPVIGVFVPPVDRAEEYSGNKMEKFTAFIIEELMPVMDGRYKTSKDPAKRVVAGASAGGNISLYIGLKHPEQFGNILAQSSNVVPAITKAFSKGASPGLSVYLDMGTYDIDFLISRVNVLRDILEKKEYRYHYEEWHEGHSWGNWKGHLRIPMMQFFPAR